MAHFYRLIVCVFALFYASSSFAVLQPVVKWRAYNAGITVYGASASAACSALPTVPFQNGNFGQANFRYLGSGGNCTCDMINWDGKVSHIGACGTVTQEQSCPDGSASNGAGGCACASNLDEFQGQCIAKCVPPAVRKSDGSCVKPNPCQTGYHEEGGACVLDKCKDTEIRVNGFCVPDPDICPDGKRKVDGKCPQKKCERDKPFALAITASMPTAMCEGQCMYMTSNAVTCADDQGKANCMRTYYSTGGTCNDPPGESSSNGGGGSGGTGGTGGSGGSGGTGSGGGGSGGGSGAGGGTGGTGGNASNNKPDHKPNIDGTAPDGNGTCAPGTYKAEGKCYPNKTDTKPTDNGTESGTCPTGYRKEGKTCTANQPPPDEDKKKNFCEENKELDICKKGSFSGACDGNFACEGDAIQCAIARDQHIRNCQMFDTPNAASKLFDKEANKEGSQSKDLPGNETIDLGSQLDTTNVLGAGSCIGDLTIEVMGVGVTLEFSRVCPYLELFGNILVAVAFVSAVAIVFKGQ